MCCALNLDLFINFRHTPPHRSFEVVDLALMRSPEYRAAFQAVDESGGLYYFRWGDAPIRTLLVLALLPRDQIHHFRIVGYKHQALDVSDDYRDPLPARTIHPGYPESEDANIIAIAAETGLPLPPGMTVALETLSRLPAPVRPVQGDEPSASPELPSESTPRETGLFTLQSLGRDTYVLVAALTLFFIWMALRRGRGRCCTCGPPTAGKLRPGVKLLV